MGWFGESKKELRSQRDQARDLAANLAVTNENKDAAATVAAGARLTGIPGAGLAANAGTKVLLETNRAEDVAQFKKDQGW